MHNSIIVIEDNDTMRLGIEESLRRQDYDVHAYDNGPDAINAFKKKPSMLAIIDLKMEPMDGNEVLAKIKELFPETEILMISAFGTVETAVNSMQKGASDFLTKPFSPDELRVRVKNLLQKIEREQKIVNLIEQNRLLNEELQTGFGEIIGDSKAIKEIFTIINQVASNDTTVLIQGESGTGKELVARAIHNKSNRADKPFIKVNCGALNDNLLESELFGHDKGAFTGAIRQKKGRFELADSGTLFLDEIGDVSPSMQVKLLRVLQENEFERVGGETTIKTDVRIISSTNKDLPKLISEEIFRDDLFYRLSVIPIRLPALRERKEDIPLLVSFFLKKLAEKMRQPAKTIGAEEIKILQEYSWPGNIRELENLVERLVVICPTENVEFDLIARHLTGKSSLSNGIENLPLDEAIYNFEKNLIQQAMKKADGVKNRAAKLLGIKTSALYYKLEKFGMI
jgi:two-component system, NtrC family, response regulator HydG